MRLPWHRRDHRELTRATECLNCGTTLNGLNFCPTCGQENFDHRTSLGRLVMFWWDRNVSIDGKLMRTLGVMLTRPGALTVAYLAGQRARYTPPLQLYFLTGLLYFFLLGWVLEKELEVADDRTIAADTLRRTSPLPITAMDSARRAAVVKDTRVKEREIGLRFGPTPRGQPAVYADLSDAPVSDSLRGLKQDSIGRRIARLGGWYKATDDLREAFISESAKVAIERVFKRQLEALTLLSLPLFALALYLFYRRSHPYFIDHLVAATHYYTFSFFVALPLFALGEGELSTWASIALVGVMLGYLVLSLRTIYRPAWGWLIWHILVLLFYSVILMSAMLVLAWLGNVAADWAVLRWAPQLWAAYSR